MDSNHRSPAKFFGCPVDPQFTFRNINQLPRDRDRWFESISLQRRVSCEPFPAATTGSSQSTLPPGTRWFVSGRRLRLTSRSLLSRRIAVPQPRAWRSAVTAHRGRSTLWPRAVDTAGWHRGARRASPRRGSCRGGRASETLRRPRGQESPAGDCKILPC